MDSFSKRLLRVRPVPMEQTSAVRMDYTEPRCSWSAEGYVSTVTHTQGPVCYSTAVHAALLIN